MDRPLNSGRLFALGGAARGAALPASAPPRLSRDKLYPVGAEGYAPVGEGHFPPGPLGVSACIRVVGKGTGKHLFGLRAVKRFVNVVTRPLRGPYFHQPGDGLFQCYLAPGGPLLPDPVEHPVDAAVKACVSSFILPAA